MKDFKIKDNLILTKKKVIAIMEVEPFDIALLSEDDRGAFYQKMKQMLNVLPCAVQILAVKEQAEVKYYSKHFRSIAAEAKQASKDKLIQNYIDELSAIIEAGEVIVLKYYLIFSVDAVTANPIKVVKRTRKLARDIERVVGALLQTGITAKQLTGKKLANFIKRQMR